MDRYSCQGAMDEGDASSYDTLNILETDRLSRACSLAETRGECDRDSEQNSTSPVSVLSLPSSFVVNETTRARPESSSASSVTPTCPTESTYHDILARASLSAFGLDVSSIPTSSRTPRNTASFRSTSPSPSIIATPEPKLSFLREQTRVLMTDVGAEVEVTLGSECGYTYNGTSTPSPVKRSHSIPVPPTPPPARSSSSSSDGDDQNRILHHRTSLLDSEETPSPAPRGKLFHDKTPPSRAAEPRLFPICCGVGPVGCFSPEDAVSVYAADDPQKNVARTITAFLSDPAGAEKGGWCNGWQAWSHFGVAASPEAPYNSEMKDDMKHILRNRACNMNSRHRRIRRLKNDFDPFDTTPCKNAALPLGRTSSFSASKQPRSGQRRFGTTSTEISVWETMTCSVTVPTNDSPFVIRTRGLAPREDELCYDSDPEEITRGRSPSKARSLDSSTSVLKELNRGGSFESLDSPTRKHRGGRTSVPIFDDDDDAVIKATVQSFMNETFTFVWHPSPNDASSNGKPQAIKAWIERGQQLNKSLVHPKFVWKPLHCSKSKKGLSIADPKMVDLLDMTRILEVNSIDRTQYPFAKPNRSLLIECLDQRMMFEASSESERDWIVHSLKLMVSRLGSKIIVEDKSVFDEFFSSVPAVPGTSPVKLLLNS